MWSSIAKHTPLSTWKTMVNASLNSSYVTSEVAGPLNQMQLAGHVDHETPTHVLKLVVGSFKTRLVPPLLASSLHVGWRRHCKITLSHGEFLLLRGMVVRATCKKSQVNAINRCFPSFTMVTPSNYSLSWLVKSLQELSSKCDWCRTLSLLLRGL